MPREIAALCLVSLVSLKREVDLEVQTGPVCADVVAAGELGRWRRSYHRWRTPPRDGSETRTWKWHHGSTTVGSS
uniref:Uncharacterized protein n=1 Tax=Oryza glumipatula TaxID=40148 RepID=A0A0E0A8Q7_9ORYZ